MTRLEIRTLARKRLGETTESFWSDSELNNWINFGCSDVAQKSKCLRTNGYISTTEVAANTSAAVASEWTLSTNFTNLLGVYEVQFHTDGKRWQKLEPITRDDLDIRFQGWRDAVGRTYTTTTTYNYECQPGIPDFYWWDYEEDKLGIYPPCNSDNATSNNLRVFYTYDHTNISADVDSPTLPDPLHLCVIEFVVATGFSTRGLGEKSNDAWNKYHQMIKDYQIERNRAREDEDVIMKPYRRI